MRLMRISWPAPRWSAFLLPGGLLATAMLLAAVFRRYPEAPEGLDAHRAAVLAPLWLAVLAVAVLWADTRPRKNRVGAGRNSGIATGLICGVLWIAEISFNNFVDPRWSTAATRLIVDDGFWALIAAIIAAVSFREARRGRFVDALAAGIWSGTVSGLVACLTALSLIVFGMPALLADQVNIAEYAARVPSGVPDMATYFAYETLAGAFGHLVPLGVIMGALLGLVGGLPGLLLRRLAKNGPTQTDGASSVTIGSTDRSSIPKVR